MVEFHNKNGHDESCYILERLMVEAVSSAL